MRKVITILIAALLVALFAGCTNDAGDNKKMVQSQAGQGHGPVPNASEKPPVVGMVGVVKGQKLLDYPDKTVGEAFDAYHHYDKNEWRESSISHGKVYVDYVGTKRSSIANLKSWGDQIFSSGVEVKFVVTTSGKFYVAMISRIENRTDGKTYAYPLEDKKRILDAIYANKEINF